MGLRSAARELFKSDSNIKKRTLTTEPLSDYYDRTMNGSTDVDFGVTVTNTTAIKFSATYAAIRLRAENIASLPKNIRQNTAKGPIVVDHPISRLIDVSPNDYTNVFDFWECMCAALDGWGNAYAIIERGSAGGAKALHQVHPSNVTVLVTKDRQKFFRVGGTSYFDGIYSNNEMLHFMLLSFDGIKGVNPIEYNKISFGKALAAQKFGAEFYSKGGNIKSVMETDNHLGDTEYNNFMKHYKATANNYETPLLEYGIKYKQIGITPISAQLLSTEEYSITDIARIFNVPPHMIGDLTRSTFSNIEQQTIQFAQYSLRPTLKRLEVEAENKLFFERERGQFSMKFNLDGLLRGDTATRGEWYAKMIQNGIYNRNEVRILEGKTAVDGLDTYLFPSNLAEVGKEKVI